MIQNKLRSGSRTEKNLPETCTLIFSPAEPLRELSYHSPVLQCFAFQGLIGQKSVKTSDLCRPSPDVTILKCYECGCESPPRHVTHWSLWIVRLSRIGRCRAHHNVLNVAPGAPNVLLLPNAKQLNRTEPLRFSTLIICRILSDLHYHTFIHICAWKTILVILCKSCV